MTSLSLNVHLDGPPLPDRFKRLEQKLARALRDATETIGREALLMPLRDATRAALNSPKLPTTWRLKVYPAAGVETFNPAVFVWSEAPRIISAFSSGDTVIKPVNGGRWLWIPTENVPRTRGGARMREMDLGRLVKKWFFLPARNGNMVVCAQAAITPRRKHRKGFARATKADVKGGNAKLVVMYVLVKQVTLRQRLDLNAIVTRARSEFAVGMQAAVESLD